MSQRELDPKDALRAIELGYVEKTMLSHRTWKQCSERIQFPTKKNGLVIVDVGGGASEVTAVLASQGAKAYAIDPRYLMRVGEIVAMARRNFKSGKDKDDVEKSLIRFEKDFRGHKSRYIARTASDLPFADNSVDFLFSSYCISFFLDNDWVLLKAAADEAIRVIKVGGEIQIAPFFDDELMRIWSSHTGIHYLTTTTASLRDLNQKQLLEYLSTISGIEPEVVFNDFPLGYSGPVRLTIRKK